MSEGRGEAGLEGLANSPVLYGSLMQQPSGGEGDLWSVWTSRYMRAAEAESSCGGPAH